MRYGLLPRFLQIELTYGCNSSCTFCYNPTHKRQIDDSLRFRILEKVNEYRIPHVQLIGGEVTTLKELPAFLDALPDVPWKSVVTNGRIFVPELVGRVDEIYLSLHGTPEEHEKITKAPGSFSAIERSVKGYVSAGIAVHSDTVLTKLNAHLLYDVAVQAKELGMSVLFVNIFQPAGIGSRFPEPLAPSLEQIRDGITQMLRARDELGVDVRFGTSTPFCFDERLVSEGLTFTCGVGTWFASIDPWGEFRICNQSTQSFGNILTTPLHEIWHSENIDREYRALKWLEVSEPCGSCVFKHECLGGCRISDTGRARIDPIVATTPEALLDQLTLSQLKQQYWNPEHQYRGLAQS